jgi:plasmid stabilization system protein ParE
MTHEIALSARAEKDRDEAFAWYESHYSRTFAVKWYNGLTRAIRSLRQNPLRCPLARENSHFSFEVRELLYGGRHQKHRILFTMHANLVLVLHIRHSARQDLTESDLFE